MMNRTYLHPLPLRAWHWINAFLIVVLIVTGIQLRVFGIPILGPRHSALWFHKYAGWGMVASFLFWLVYSLGAGHLSRHYIFRGRDLGGIFGQAKFYLYSIFKGEENPFQPTPEGKFNPLQKAAYGAVMLVFSPLLIVTGFLCRDIVFIRDYIVVQDIVWLGNVVHVLAAYVFLSYLIVHIYMATLGRTAFSHIKAMISGYEDEQKSEA
ncbi:MAG TPA: cytochrome b/b6 domain-containing protein [Thermodesulfobacteriota bacterium]|nr:cytochrome b/b6 domain-containing protein [Thermodesulfobacteriota bacterium]